VTALDPSSVAGADGREQADDLLSGV